MTAFLSPAVVMGVNVVVLTNFILFSKDDRVSKQLWTHLAQPYPKRFCDVAANALVDSSCCIDDFFYGSDLASKCFFGILPVFHVGLLEHRRGAGVVAGVVNGSMPRF
jgi:hypothetical protein